MFKCVTMWVPLMKEDARQNHFYYTAEQRNTHTHIKLFYFSLSCLKYRKSSMFVCQLFVCFSFRLFVFYPSFLISMIIYFFFLAFILYFLSTTTMFSNFIKLSIILYHIYYYNICRHLKISFIWQVNSCVTCTELCLFLPNMFCVL